jgi:hypothetical protein
MYISIQVTECTHNCHEPWISITTEAWYDAMPFRVGFMGKVALGQFSVFWFFCVNSVLLPMLNTRVSLIYHWCHLIIATELCVVFPTCFNASVRRSKKWKIYYKEDAIFRFLF